MEILQKGIRWGAAGLWKYYRRESSGERRGYGNTTEGNPLGSGHGNGVGDGWGALTGLTPQCERGEQRGRGGKLADAEGVLPQAQPARTSRDPQVGSATPTKG